MTAESTAQQRDVPDVWDGLTVWLPSYGCRMQGATDVAFTVLDALGYLDEIPVCVGYEIDGKETTDFPTTPKLAKAKPVMEETAGLEMRYPRYQKVRRTAWRTARTM